MRTAAIFNVWDGIELLYYAVDNIKPVVDGVIIVWSEMSNKQVRNDEFKPENFKDCILVKSEPKYLRNPSESEREKRNVGLNKAKELGYTHFIMMDCDEFYDQQEFKQEKERIYKDDLNGLVCNVQVYFREPTLTIGLDPSTRVPFIQRITNRLRFRSNKGYPFAYDATGGLRIDPTRHLTHNKGIEWSDIIMHHYSWIRKDIVKKVQNSSANLGRSSCLEDYGNAKEGYFCKMYNRKLEKCENKFYIQI